ncbi:MAG: hypothetical protein PHD13_05250 [Methanocellales archaeon]|nr:hypothetical protein [Methanocellales archaeon]MDD3292060.1 hypothetical protein [Methanocellales archaeon]MDD5235559.1 hypothetical protein [Methanocellales archaeon]MDD5485583.1 hypothetical protein [Methanocellales archaeon]
MKGNKGLSILAGVIMGFILGMWIYSLVGYMLVSGPVVSGIHRHVPLEVRKALLIKALKFGAAPGTFVGFIAGLVIPQPELRFHFPRGHMAKSIGCFCWIPITALAWITNWSNVYAMSGWEIAGAVGMTFISLVLIIPISGTLGHYVERIQEL